VTTHATTETHPSKETPVHDPRPRLLRAADQIAGLVDPDLPLAAPTPCEAQLDRDVTVPWGVVPGRAAGWGYVRELAVHAWDLASALGTVDALDPALADVVVDRVRAALPAEPRGGGIPFGPVVEVPDDAGAYERLVGWLGRDPSWATAGHTGGV
jgi:uncharacterized protein (TIGR03086 family)